MPDPDLIKTWVEIIWLTICGLVFGTLGITWIILMIKRDNEARRIRKDGF